MGAQSGNGAHHCMGIEQFTNTEMVVRKDILEKANELAMLITTSDEVQTFQKAEKQIRDNEQIQSLIQLMKKKQKEIVAFEQFENKAMVEKIELEMQELEQQLDQYPIVNQFRQTQDDINYLLQLIVDVIRDKVSEKVSIEQ